MKPVAVVTGAGNGIGRAIARRLAADGMTVAAVDVDGPAAEDVATSVGGLALVADVSDSDGIDRLAGELAERVGVLRVLVNNAGIFRQGDLGTTRTEDARAVLDVNVLGTWFCSRALAPHIEPGGSVVNISSVNADMPSTGVGLYPASKGAIVTMTKQLAVELGPRGIRVNCVAPGMVRTGATEESYRDGGRASVVGGLPLARVGTPEDVAGSVSFLVGPDAAYVTGAVIKVDGGLTLVGR